MWAEDDVRVQVAGWIAELRSDDFATREAARKQLQLHGLKARDLLEAAEEDADAEVRRTVRAILARSPSKVTPNQAEVAPGDFRSLGTITLQASEEALPKLLARMGAPVWASVNVPASAEAKTVTLDLKETPFFEALERVLRPLDLHAPRPFDTLGVVAAETVDKDVPPAPSAAAGPMRLRVTEVSATRTLGSNAPRKYALGLELSWAPFVQVAQTEVPRLEVAKDPEGRAYRATAAMERRINYGVSSQRRHHTFTFHVEPTSPDCKPTLAVLQLRVTLMLRYDPVRVAFDASKALPQTKDGVTLHAIEAVEGGRGQYIVDFSAALPEGVADRSLTAHVIEKDGRLSNLSVYGGRSRAADGTVRIRARAWRGSRGAPPGIRVAWHRREERGTLPFRLTDIPLR